MGGQPFIISKAKKVKEEENHGSFFYNRLESVNNVSTIRDNECHCVRRNVLLVRCRVTFRHAKFKGVNVLPSYFILLNFLNYICSIAGYYVFVPKVPDSQITSETGRILSPLFVQNSNARCLEFYFFMNGINDAGSLNAYILPEDGILPNTPDWSSSTNMGNVWNAGRLNVPPQTANFQVSRGISK